MFKDQNYFKNECVKKGLKFVRLSNPNSPSNYGKGTMTLLCNCGNEFKVIACNLSRNKPNMIYECLTCKNRRTEERQKERQKEKITPLNETKTPRAHFHAIASQKDLMRFLNHDKNPHNEYILKKLNNPTFGFGDRSTHSHHIIPKHAGGCNASWNLLTLTPEEHYLVHYLRFKVYKHPGDKFSLSLLRRGWQSDIPKVKLKTFSMKEIMELNCVKNSNLFSTLMFIDKNNNMICSQREQLKPGEVKTVLTSLTESKLEGSTCPKLLSTKVEKPLREVACSPQQQETSLREPLITQGEVLSIQSKNNLLKQEQKVLRNVDIYLGKSPNEKSYYRGRLTDPVKFRLEHDVLVRHKDKDKMVLIPGNTAFLTTDFKKIFINIAPTESLREKLLNLPPNRFTPNVYSVFVGYRNRTRAWEFDFQFPTLQYGDNPAFYKGQRLNFL